MKKIIISVSLLLGLSTNVVGQSTTATNNQNLPQSRFIGFNNNFPLDIRTALF